MPKGYFKFARYWLDKIEIGDPGECWRWVGAHDEKGYPRVRIEAHNGRVGRVHRMVAELTHGAAGRVVHHRCENPGCVNPDHLEVMETNGEHSSLHSRIPCDHDDFYVTPEGWKRCRVCRNRKSRAKRASRD